MITDPYHCTRAALDEMVRELAELRGPARDQLREHFGEAQGEETELEENTGYQLALNELAALDARIAQIEDLVRRAVVGGPTEGCVGVGSLVTVSLRAPGERRGHKERFLVDSALRHELPDDVVVVSPTSPMGRRLMGTRPRQRITWTAPGGDFSATVVDVTPGG